MTILSLPQEKEIAKTQIYLGSKELILKVFFSRNSSQTIIWGKAKLFRLDFLKILSNKELGQLEIKDML